MTEPGMAVVYLLHLCRRAGAALRAAGAMQRALSRQLQLAVSRGDGTVL